MSRNTEDRADRMPLYTLNILTSDRNTMLPSSNHSPATRVSRVGSLPVEVIVSFESLAIKDKPTDMCFDTLGLLQRTGGLWITADRRAQERWNDLGKIVTLRV